MLLFQGVPPLGSVKQ